MLHNVCHNSKDLHFRAYLWKELVTRLALVYLNTLFHIIVSFVSLVNAFIE